MQGKYISIGKIINFHGILGDVKVGYTKGKEHQLLGEKYLFVKKDGDFLKLEISKIRFHKNTALIKFVQINSINEAQEYKGCAIYTPVENLRKNLEEDEFLVDDLVGAQAFNLQGDLVGVVSAINKQGSSDLLSVKNNEGKEFFVPFVKELVPTVDLADNKIIINAIEGLIE